MTSTELPPGGLDDRLSIVVGAAQHLNTVLEDLITQPSSLRDGTGRHATISHSVPPWNARAAYLLLDLAALVRGIEVSFKAALGIPERPRGGSDHNTQLALRAIPELALGVGEVTVSGCLAALEAWERRARETLGEIEPLRHLPRLEGQPEPRCPWCRRQTLRHQAQAGLVRCVNPVCYDEDGQRPRARIEVGRYSSEPLLVWQDRTTGLTVTDQ